MRIFTIAPNRERRQLRFGMLYFLFCTSTLWSVAREEVIVIDRPGVFTLQRALPGCSAEVLLDKEHSTDPWPEEWLMLRVTTSKGKIIGLRRFQSSYGQFCIHVIDLDADRNPEFLFLLGKGRGTSAREEALNITHLINGRFQDVLSMPISGFYGPGAEWRYTIEYQDRSLQGTVPLVLRLRVPPQDIPTANRGLIPKEAEKTIHWEAPMRGKASAVSVVNAPLVAGPTGNWSKKIYPVHSADFN